MREAVKDHEVNVLTGGEGQETNKDFSSRKVISIRVDVKIKTNKRRGSVIFQDFKWGAILYLK